MFWLLLLLRVPLLLSKQNSWSPTRRTEGSGSPQQLLSVLSPGLQDKAEEEEDVLQQDEFSSVCL